MVVPSCARVRFQMNGDMTCFRAKIRSATAILIDKFEGVFPINSNSKRMANLEMRLKWNHESHETRAMREVLEFEHCLDLSTDCIVRDYKEYEHHKVDE
jgi:hypothetical protein